MSSWIQTVNADGTKRLHTVYKVPTRPVKIAKAVRVAGGRVLCVSPDGKLYGVEGFPTRSASYVGHSWPWLPPLAQALKSLGVISEADRLATVEACERERAANSVADAADAVKHYAPRAGITLTQAQLRKLGKAAEAAGGRWPKGGK